MGAKKGKALEVLSPAAQGIEQAVSQIEAIINTINSAPAEAIGDIDVRLFLLEQAARKVKATQAAMTRIGVMRVRLNRRIGQLLVDAGDGWRAEAERAGVTAHLGARAKRLAQVADEPFEKTLAELASFSVPTPTSVLQRAGIYAAPGNYGVGDTWRTTPSDRGAYWGDDNPRWDPAKDELGEQVALEVAEALNAGGQISIADLCERVLAEDPELIIGLDPPGKEVMRRRLRSVARRVGVDHWPVVYTHVSPGQDSKFTYVAFDYATVEHARTDLSVKRDNVFRVLKAYRSLRRLVRTLDGLPGDTRLADVVKPPQVIEVTEVQREAA